MKYAVVFLSLAMILSAILGIGYGENVIDSRIPQYLYVLSAKSGSLEEDTLTLNDIPLVIYFSDRPDRVAGHMSLKKFVEMWEKGQDSFKADPPNATLSIDSNDDNENAVVELMSVQLKGDILTYKVHVLEGNVPKSFGPFSLFVDDYPPSGVPIKPGLDY